MHSSLTIAVLVCGTASLASAADTFYMGTWKIMSAVVTPWWNEANRKPGVAEMKSLVGKIITIEPKAIRGPRELGCTDPRYHVKNYPADMLFQGAFGEMHRRDESVDPVKVAAALGFRGSSTWKTLETGCAVEIDYHFIDPVTATFGLNDYVYTLKKQP